MPRRVQLVLNQESGEEGEEEVEELETGRVYEVAAPLEYLIDPLEHSSPEFTHSIETP